MLRIIVSLPLLLLGFGSLLVQTDSTSTPDQPAQRQFSQEKIERGAYLVENVAMCVQCHTPRNRQGVLDRAHLLEGAPMPVDSPYPNQQFAFHAPTLAGLPGWTVEDAVSFLQTGKRLGGMTPRPPMPPFRMNRDDAEAVVAYLKSLR